MNPPFPISPPSATGTPRVFPLFPPSLHTSTTTTARHFIPFLLPSSSRYSPLSLSLSRWGELHSTSGPLMDDEWSKGCECTESALLPSPVPVWWALSPFLSWPSAGSRGREGETGRRRKRRREDRRVRSPQPGGAPWLRRLDTYLAAPFMVPP